MPRVRRPVAVLLFVLERREPRFEAARSSQRHLSEIEIPLELFRVGFDELAFEHFGELAFDDRRDPSAVRADRIARGEVREAAFANPVLDLRFDLRVSLEGPFEIVGRQPVPATVARVVEHDGRHLARPQHAPHRLPMKDKRERRASEDGAAHGRAVEPLREHSAVAHDGRLAAREPREDRFPVGGRRLAVEMLRFVACALELFDDLL